MKRPVAAFLSLLVISSLALASTCDLACSLRATHSGCHAASATSENDDRPMDMDSSMNMASMKMPDMKAGAEPEDAAHLRRIIYGFKPTHSMQPEIGILTEQFENTPVLELGGAAHKPPKHSSCDQGVCGRISSTARPPGPSQSLTSFSCPAVIGTPNRVMMQSEIDLTVPQIAPHQDRNLLSDFATTLRI